MCWAFCCPAWLHTLYSSLLSEAESHLTTGDFILFSWMHSLAFGCIKTHFVTVWIRSLCNTDLPSLSPYGSTCSNVLCQFYWFLAWQLLPHTLSPHCEFISLLCQTSVDILLFLTEPLLKFPHSSCCWPFPTPLWTSVNSRQVQYLLWAYWHRHTVGILPVVLIEFIAWKVPLHGWPGLK